MTNSPDDEEYFREQLVDDEEDSLYWSVLYFWTHVDETE
jgi:hypothetical protein